MVFPGFNEASGTSTRNRPREPATSKPCRPQGLCTFSIVEVGNLGVQRDGSVDAELRRGGDRRGPGRRGGGGTARRQGRARRHRRGSAGGRGVLLLGLH